VWGGGPIAAAVAAISLLLVWRHAANISRLLAGTESKLGAKRAAGAAQRRS
jgi:glycerol-3-phosphate acyltransferase PlsY